MILAGPNTDKRRDNAYDELENFTDPALQLDEATLPMWLLIVVFHTKLKLVSAPQFVIGVVAPLPHIQY